MEYIYALKKWRQKEGLSVSVAPGKERGIIGRAHGMSIRPIPSVHQVHASERDPLDGWGQENKK